MFPSPSRVIESKTVKGTGLLRIGGEILCIPEPDPVKLQHYSCTFYLFILVFPRTTMPMSVDELCMSSTRGCIPGADSTSDQLFNAVSSFYVNARLF